MRKEVLNVFGRTVYVFSDVVVSIYVEVETFRGLRKCWVTKIEIRGSIVASELAIMLRKIRKELGCLA